MLSSCMQSTLEMNWPQKHSRAPRHGNLGNVRIPHAACSGSARRDKTSTKMIPNDPEVNPGAFSHRTGGTCSFFRSSSTKSSSPVKQQGAHSAGSHRRGFFDELKRKSFGTKKGFSPSDQRSSRPSGQRKRGQPVDDSVSTAPFVLRQPKNFRRKHLQDRL